MSRYSAVECYGFKNTFLSRFREALTSIEKNYRDMDFENAREKEVDMRAELDAMKKLLLDAQSELSGMGFE
jgi:hypothetical protein